MQLQSDDSGDRAERAINPVAEGLYRTGLYHSIRLPGGDILEGAMTLEWQDQRFAAFGLPESLHGKRALDIGPWDGFYTFELERRGADVVCIDYVDLDTFRNLHRTLGSRADYRRLDIYELDPKDIGAFDIVLCLGVLYHLKHPLLAIEKLCAVCRDVCVIDTFVVDGTSTGKGTRPSFPYAEFYEYGELGGQTDNWCGPSVDMVEAWIRAAGFARAEVRRITGSTACVVGHRHWGVLPEDREPPIEVYAVTSHLNRGRTFRSEKEEYVVIWCRWQGDAAPKLSEVFPEVDGFGVAPLACALNSDGVSVNVRLPPGLPAGSHHVRVKIGNAAWSQPWDVYLDLPPIANEVAIGAIQDGIAWKANEVDWTGGGWLTLWATGLSPEVDPGNVTVVIAGVPHSPHTVDPATGQVNVQLRPVVRAGEHSVTLSHRGAHSAPVFIHVVGTPPPVHGLERLQ